MKRLLVLIPLAVFTLVIGFVSGRVSDQLKLGGQPEVLGCTTTCYPPACGGLYPCDYCDAPVCTGSTPTPGPGGSTPTPGPGGSTPTPGPGGSTPTPGPGSSSGVIPTVPPGFGGCSTGCECWGDDIGGCWCECTDPTTLEPSRDTSQFACEGDPACEWGPTGCYCCLPGVVCGAAPSIPDGGGGSSSGAPPTPTPVGGCSPTTWGPWSSCFGSPAVKTRQNQCGDWETTNCTGTIQARAVIIDAGASCAGVQSSTLGVPSATHQFSAGSASQPAAQVQSGASYVSFNGIVGGNYTTVPTVPADYILNKVCWQKSLNSPASGEGLSTTLSISTESDTLTWNLGYTVGTPWVQTQEGSVFAGSTLRSYIPGGATPRTFILDGAGGYAGAAIYGTSYDFDSQSSSLGAGYISSSNWLVNETFSGVNYYELFWRRLGGGTTADSFADLGAVAKPASRTTPYYVVGDMTTTGDWNIPNGETVIFIVNGNLTLGGKVTLTGSGFASFIVNGNITVSSSVGGLYTSSTPVIEGIYITSPTGTFKTGTSSVVGKERLVAKGIFVGGGFLLQRDLDSVDANPTTSSELFIYNPRLLFSMPDSMRDVPITWAEVAP